MPINREKRLNPLWPMHAVEYYAASEKNLEILHTLTYPDTNSDDRADYFAKIKIYSLMSQLKTSEKKKSTDISQTVNRGYLRKVV